MSRHYKKNVGDKIIKYPSVTTIISDCTDSSGALTQWAANMTVEYMKEYISDDPFCPYKGSEIFELLEKARFNFRKVSQKALDIGSEVHNAIEMHLQNKAFKITTPQGTQAYNAFLEWKKEVDLKPISLEQTVWGDRWAGTLDFYGYYKDKLYVIDWKTSKAFYPEMRYQVAAYRYAIRYQEFETFFKPIEGCGILRLDKETGIPEFKDTSKTFEKDLKIFNRMVDLYFERHPRIAKQFDSIIPF